MSKKEQILYCFIALTVSYFDVLAQDLRPFLNTYVDSGEAPYVVFVKVKVDDKYVRCTGSILDKNWVLTSASCVYSPMSMQLNVTVVANVSSYDLGNKGVQPRQVVEVITHPLFKPNRLGDVDLALLKVQVPFDISPSVQPILLDTRGWWREDGKPAMRQCSVFGYGDIDYTKYDSRLKIRSVKVTHSDTCACTRRNQWRSLICLDVMEDVALCPADNGAPLVCSGMLVGIAHMLIVKNNCSEAVSPDEICGDYSVVTYFLYLCPFLTWIQTSVIMKIPSDHLDCDHASSTYLSLALLLILILLVYFQ